MRGVLKEQFFQSLYESVEIILLQEEYNSSTAHNSKLMVQLINSYGHNRLLTLWLFRLWAMITSCGTYTESSLMFFLEDDMWGKIQLTDSLGNLATYICVASWHTVFETFPREKKCRNYPWITITSTDVLDKIYIRNHYDKEKKEKDTGIILQRKGIHSEESCLTDWFFHPHIYKIHSSCWIPGHLTWRNHGHNQCTSAQQLEKNHHR